VFGAGGVKLPGLVIRRARERRLFRGRVRHATCGIRETI
jgi:GH24 family phage-related lysozyme (muramidase)